MHNMRLSILSELLVHQLIVSFQRPHVLDWDRWLPFRRVRLSIQKLDMLVEIHELVLLRL